jgi:ABC-2 type transport system permease protein
MKPFIGLTIGAFKRDFRDINTLVFAVLIPIAFIFLFGSLFGGGNTPNYDLGLLDNAKTEQSKALITKLTDTKAFKVKELSESEIRAKIEKGDLSMGLIIPKEFDPASSKLEFLTSAGKPQETGVASQILSQIVNGEYNYKDITPKVFIERKEINSKNLGILDFLIPGLIANSIMQLGIFGTAMAFISQRATGVLKRLLATPIRSYHIILAEGIESVTLTLFQICLLLGIGVGVYKIQIVGSLFWFFLLALLGIIVFLGFGFCIAGVAKDEKQAPALANLIGFPMLMLSGVFFARDIFPDWLQKITDFFPLTFLVDGMRAVINNGAGLDVIGKDMIGLVIWGVIAVFAASKLFKWE